MTNRLIKSTRITYQQGSAYVPADPGQPWLPAYTYTYTTQVCRPQSSPYKGATTSYAGTGDWPEMTYEQQLDAALMFLGMDYIGGGQYVQQGGGSRGSVSPPMVCSNVTTTVNIPSQPYIPPTPEIPGTLSQLITDFNIGWNSGAHSKAVLVANGYASFYIAPGSAGIVIGLNDADNSTLYAEIEYAFFFEHGIAKLMENGEDKGYIGPFSATDKWTIHRQDGVVTYLKNDILLYTSAVPSTAMLALDTSMYSGGDEVFNAEVVEFYNGGGDTILPYFEDYASGKDLGEVYVPPEAGLNELPYYSSLGWEVTRYGTSENTLPYFTASGRSSPITVAYLPYFTNLGYDRVYGDGRGELQPFENGYSGAGLLEPTYALAATSLSFMTVAGIGLTGEIGGQTESDLLVYRTLASEGPYGEGVGELQEFSAFGYAYEGMNNASIYSYGLIAGRNTINVEAYVVFDSSGTATGIFTVELLQDIAMAEELNLLDSYTIDADVAALLTSALNARGILNTPDQDYTAWAINTDTTANSRYEGFPFNSFGKFDGRYFGAKWDGVFLLEGERDDTAPINSMVSFGKQDFGTSAFKAMPWVYMGIAASGDVYLKVIANEVPYIYRVRNMDDYLATQRVDLGKGLRANYYELELYSGDGSQFELDAIDFKPIALTRSI